MLSFNANLPKFLTFLLLIVGILLLLFQFWFFVLWHPHLPIRDSIVVLPLVQQALDPGLQSVSISDWLAPYAGAHRIALTRLLMVADYRFFGGQNHLIFAVSWASLGVLVALFVLTGRRQRNIATWEVIFLSAISLVCLFSARHFFNISNPINGSWMTALSGSAIALFCLLAKNSQTRELYRLLTAAIFGILAALSNFSGIFVWILAPLILLIHKPRCFKVGSIVCATFVILYALGIEDSNGGYSNSNALIAVVTDLPVNTARYLAAPFSGLFPLLSRWISAFSAIAIGVAWAILIWQKKTQAEEIPSAITFYLSMSTICLLTAVSTSVGRGIFFNADALRYHSVTACYWLAVSCLIVLHPMTRMLVPALPRISLASVLALGTAQPYLDEDRPEAGVELFQKALNIERTVISDQLSLGHQINFLRHDPKWLWPQFAPWAIAGNLSIYRNLADDINLNEPEISNSVKACSADWTVANEIGEKTRLEYHGESPILSRKVWSRDSTATDYVLFPSLCSQWTLRSLLLRPDRCWEASSGQIPDILQYSTASGPQLCSGL